jgi:hypothetical protein
MEEIIAFYESSIEACSQLITRLQKKIHVLGTARLLLCVAAIANLWLLWERDWLLLAGIALLYAVPFAALMVYHEKLSRRKAFKEALSQLCADELKGLDYDFSAFDGAPERIDGEHSFSLDLDVFGGHSLFQSINRTVTFMGKELLADWFTQPLTDKEAILRRQEAIRELSGLTSLRQDFYVEGILRKGSREDLRQLSRLAGMPAAFAGNSFWRLAVWVTPIGWAVAIAGLAAGYLPLSLFGTLFALSALVAYCRVGRISKLHNAVNKMEKILAAYSRLMKAVEGASFTSPVLSGIRNCLVGEEAAASQAVRQLSAHIGTLDQRGTFTGALLNIFTFRDIRAAIAIEKWNQLYGAETARWFEALATFDALSSLAGFSFNHPDYIYPTLVDSYFHLSGKELGHPLIPRNVCVKNGITINHSPLFLIITGANMAGKSTYLRTVGINFLLAGIGAPVCAASLAVYPARLVTSLRTSDSLAGNESYFFAELKRLKMIIDCLQQGQELFIILDEILKGTNSIDKQKGSFALVKQLIARNACGIIATHDLALGSLEQEFAGQIKNYRFEADISGDSLAFNYCLREGIARNMNATFLMKQMGITL